MPQGWLCDWLLPPPQVFSDWESCLPSAWWHIDCQMSCKPALSCLPQAGRVGGSVDRLASPRLLVVMRPKLGMAPWAWLGTQPYGQCPETSWVAQGSGRKYSCGQA